MGLIYRIFAWIFWTANDCAYLMMSKHSFRNKIKILLAYLKLSLKLATVNKIFKIRRERILGFRVNFFDYTIMYILFREIFLRQLYYFESKNKNPLILDCGANIGLATIFFKWMYPNSEVYAFEPDPITFEILEKNVNQNGFKNVHLYNAAVLDRDGKINFYMDRVNPGLLEMSIKPHRKYKDKIEANCLSLANFIKDKVDFAKFDIEGSESIVIKHLHDTKKLDKIKELVLEYHFRIKGDDTQLSKFFNLLEDSGFEYQMDTKCVPLYSKDEYQEILIFAYRK